MNQFARYFSVGILLFGVASPLVAQQKGLPHLDQATDLQLSADTIGELEKVVELCEKALKEGLDAENQKFAKELASSSLYEMARRRAAELGDREQRAKRWQSIRDLSLRDLDRAVGYDDKNAQIYIMR